MLARQLALDNSIYPADGIEPVENLGSAVPFRGEIVEERKEKAIEQAKNTKWERSSGQTGQT